MKSFLFSLLLLGSLASGWAATTINSTNKFSYGANIGWMDWRGDTNGGAVIGDYVCSGYVYSANVGWINLGSGAPTNGIRYQNISGNDFGVNHDGAGNLRGYAYGANIGWINFETNGNAKVNLNNGRLSGSVYSANCGWISLSNAFAFVQTDSLDNGLDSDGDGIADAWEHINFGSLTNATASSNFDGDAASDLEEFLADTNPANTNEFLRILSHTVTFNPTNGRDTNFLNWTSRPTRKYRIHFRNDFDIFNTWADTGLVISASPGTNTVQGLVFGIPSPRRFLQVEAVKLLP